MLLHKITPSVDYNKRLKRFDTQLNKPTIQNLIKVSKMVKLINCKRYHETLGTSVINNPLTFPSRGLYIWQFNHANLYF